MSIAFNVVLLCAIYVMWHDYRVMSRIAKAKRAENERLLRERDAWYIAKAKYSVEAAIQREPKAEAVKVQTILEPSFEQMQSEAILEQEKFYEPAE